LDLLPSGSDPLIAESILSVFNSLPRHFRVAAYPSTAARSRVAHENRQRAHRLSEKQ